MSVDFSTSSRLTILKRTTDNQEIQILKRARLDDLSQTITTKISMAGFFVDPFDVTKRISIQASAAASSSMLTLMSQQTGNGIMSFPDLVNSNDTLVCTKTSQELTNKTLTSATLKAPVIENPADVSILLPAAASTLATLALTETLLNKTLTSATLKAPVIENPSGVIISLPAAASTLATLALNETLLNKTLPGDSTTFSGKPIIDCENCTNIKTSAINNNAVTLSKINPSAFVGDLLVTMRNPPNNETQWRHLTVRVTKIVANGTWFSNENTVMALFECWGGGGGGAGTAALTGNVTGTCCVGGGGGGGAYMAVWVKRSELLVSGWNVVVGTGGSSGLSGTSTIVSRNDAMIMIRFEASGGLAGVQGSVGAVSQASGGAGGVLTTPMGVLDNFYINIAGEDGSNGFVIVPNNGIGLGGRGGQSIRFAAASKQLSLSVVNGSGSSGNGFSGNIYGGGGGGACSMTIGTGSPDQSLRNGGTGGAGVCYITEYLWELSM